MNTARAVSDQDVIDAVVGGLRTWTGFVPSAIKFIAGRTGRNPRTVRNWLNRDAAPTAAALIELMRESDDVHKAVMALANRNPSTTPNQDLIRKAELIMQIMEGEHGDTHH